MGEASVINGMDSKKVTSIYDRYVCNYNLICIALITQTSNWVWGDKMKHCVPTQDFGNELVVENSHAENLQDPRLPSPFRLNISHE